MRVLLVLTFLVMAWACIASPAALAQPSCDWNPSSGCPASVSRSAPSFPCYAGQIKGDWDTMLYHTANQASYASTGTGSYADVWCFSQIQDALDYGFERAFR